MQSDSDWNLGLEQAGTRICWECRWQELIHLQSSSCSLFYHLQLFKSTPPNPTAYHYTVKVLVGESRESSLGHIAGYFDLQFFQIVCPGEEVIFQGDCFCFPKKKRQMDAWWSKHNCVYYNNNIGFDTELPDQDVPSPGFSSYSEMKALSSTPG